MLLQQSHIYCIKKVTIGTSVRCAMVTYKRIKFKFVTK